MVTVTDPFLYELFVHARIGPLAIGLSADAVRELLGEPEAVQWSRKSRSLRKYGCVEIAYEPDRRASMILLPLWRIRNGESLPAPLQHHSDAIDVLAGWRLRTAVRFLRDRNIPYARQPLLCMEGQQVTLRTHDNVHVTFSGGIAAMIEKISLS